MSPYSILLMPGLNDSDPLMPPKRAPDDLVSVALDIVTGIQFKLLGLMLLVFILLSSDVFINRALSRFSGAVEYKCPTSWGVVLQGMFLVLVMMIVDALVRADVI